MVVETLMCRNGHEWQRERTGGRKPVMCVECRMRERYSAGMSTNPPVYQPESHGDATEPAAGPLEGVARGEALVRAMEPLHRLTRSDRQAQLDSILGARDYGRRRK